MTKLEARTVKILQGQGKALNAKELYKRLGLNKSHHGEFKAALDNLVARRILYEKKGRYAPYPAGGKKRKADSAGTVAATIVKVTGTFGFARPETPDAKDVFIPGRRLLGAMPGDVVELVLSKGEGSLPEGEVVSFVAKADKPFSAIVSRSRDGDFVLPDRYVRFPILLDPKDGSGAVHGDKVLAILSHRGERHSQHTAKIVGSYGDATKAQACCAAILAENDIPLTFPEEVREQAALISSFMGIHPKELEQRRDLREEVIFTIDGADSKDLDDAVSLKPLGRGWELGVHIADVSYYVTHKSPLDLEAFRRGTSVYYADSVVPMLPKELSNGICSLNPGEDRLAFSAFIKLDEKGEMISYSFEKTVIRSLVKGVYSEVNALLDGNDSGVSDSQGNTAGSGESAPRAMVSESIAAKYAGLEEILGDMRDLAALLTKNRYARGGMDLDSVESKITVGPDGSAVGVAARERGVSERIIEEFMLTANEAAAAFALRLTLPFVFRVHENPSPDKLDSLYQVLDSLGVPHKRKETAVTPATLSSILDNVRNTELSLVINTLVLRTMAKAKYSPVNIGHFGLALKHYTHFTSPIRRYPDLVIHRILSGYVTGMKRGTIDKRFTGFVTESATRSTEREIAAMTAERACEDCYKAEHMGRFVGREFDGVISGVTAFGAYVRLENTCEGMVRLADFPDGDWTFDSVISFQSNLGKKRIRLGDKVRVRIEGVNVSAGQVDMVFA